MTLYIIVKEGDKSEPAQGKAGGSPTQSSRKSWRSANLAPEALALGRVRGLTLTFSSKSIIIGVVLCISSIFVKLTTSQ